MSSEDRPWRINPFQFIMRKNSLFWFAQKIKKSVLLRSVKFQDLKTNDQKIRRNIGLLSSRLNFRKQDVEKFS